MKKFFLQMVILFCMLLGGCPNRGDVKPLEMNQWLDTTPTVAVDGDFPTPITEQHKITPHPTVVARITATELPEQPSGASMDELGIVPRSGQNGELIYEVPTFFYDENGMLCVALKAICQEKEEECVLEKSFYLPNGSLYREEDILTVQETLNIFADRMLEDACSNTVYEPIVYKTISGYVWTRDGRLVRIAELLGEEYNSKFTCTGPEDYVPVSAGEKIKIDFYFSWFPNVAGIVFLDKEDNLIVAYGFNSATEVKDQYVKVPDGAEKMHLTFFANQKYSLEREVSLNGADLSAIAEEECLQQMNSVMETSERQSKKYKAEKAHLTFVLDDCRPDMNRIADIFLENEVPLCIAAIWENLMFSVSDGTETRREVCKRVVAAGGEILAHDGDVITEELLTDYNGLAKHFYADKWVLEQMGFEVNGIILAGGSGQVVGHETTDIWARAHYLYSDLYGEQKYGEPYYHRRYWLGNCLENYQQLISEAIKEKDWVVLYLHDLKEVNAEKLQEILEYVTSLPEEEIEVVTYRKLYDMKWE